jgi:hypothetical protein
MNFPTADQIKSATRSVSISVSSMVAGAAMFGLAGAGDPQKVIEAINAIGEGLASIATGVGALITIGMGIWGFISSNPLRQLFSSTKAIAADPVKIEELQTSTIADKAPLALLTDKLPEVANVATARTEAGRELAAAVPSQTVQQKVA